MSTMTKLLLLWGFHFLCDYPLQGDFLARGKNMTAPIAGVPWYWPMTAHCGIHALAVGIILHSPALAMAEFTAHFMIDTFKCLNITSLTTDQILHLVCKAMWLV